MTGFKLPSQKKLKLTLCALVSGFWAAVLHDQEVEWSYSGNLCRTRIKQEKRS